MGLISANDRGTVFEAVVRFFQEDDWRYEQLEDRPTLKMGFKGEHGSWRCYAIVREERHLFLFYSVLDMNVPPDRRTAMAEFLAMANYGMYIGNFELDLSDGEVRYKTSIDVENDRLTSPLIKNMVYPNVLTMDKYFPGIMSVTYAGVTPTEAIAKIEQGNT
jgi:hypothetical protein